MDQKQDRPVIRTRRTKSLLRRDGLIQYAYDNTSQNGEDGILARIFQLCSLPTTTESNDHSGSTDSGNDTSSSTAGYYYYNCVDVGAWDGQHLSNTYSLLWPPPPQKATYRNGDDRTKDHRNVVDDDKDGAEITTTAPSSSSSTKKWKGVFIEADTERFAQLSRLYASRPDDAVCLHATVSVELLGGKMSNDDVRWRKNNPRSIVSLLQSLLLIGGRYQLAADFDFLCIDIDGGDYWVWHDLLTSGNYRPKVVCIEFNPTMPNDLVYIPARLDSVRHGASLSALVELADEHDYTLVETTLFNAFFVHTDLYKSYLMDDVPDTSIEALHETTMGTSLYQLYDGTIKISGCKRMLWHRLPIDEAKLQMIPNASERSFPFSPDNDNTTKETDSWQEEVVDLSPYFLVDDDSSSSSSRRNDTARRLVEQLQSTGFCYVRGTTVPTAVCRDALDHARAFLHDADETVRRSCLATDRARRGYSPMNGENFASLIGEHGPNDLVRKFRMGAVEEIVVVDDNNNVQQQSSYNALKQPNIWPVESAWASAGAFRDATEHYYQALSKAATVIMQATCEGILLADPTLHDVLQPLMTMNGVGGGEDHHEVPCHNDKNDDDTETTSILTLLGYRPGTRHKGKNKSPLVAAHTDVGVITILLFEHAIGACAKLQRRDGEDGSWRDVTLPSRLPLHDPIFVVNVADCLAALCRGAVASTLHRVVACRSGTVPRTCLALFVGLDSATRLRLPDSSEETTTITYEQWRKRRIEQSQAILRANNNNDNNKASSSS